jgi:hypothetical protein
VDADYELPVAFNLTKASSLEIKQAHKIIEELNRKHPELIEKCETMGADNRCDDTKFIVKLWDKYKIKPVIDII